MHDGLAAGIEGKGARSTVIRDCKVERVDTCGACAGKHCNII